MISIIPAKAEHVIGLELRAHDKIEFRTADVVPQDAIAQSISNANYAWTAFVDKNPAAIWGIHQENILAGAHIWLVTTPYVDQYKKSFLKLSRDVVEACTERFGFLYGYVDVEFTRSLAWMTWLGFHPTHDTIVSNIIVRRFERYGR